MCMLDNAVPNEVYDVICKIALPGCRQLLQHLEPYQIFFNILGMVQQGGHGA